MTKHLIYFDTTIWNVLAQRSPSAASSCQSLSERGIYVTLGLNAYFEMLKSFYGKRLDARARGRKLFACVHECLDSGVRIIKTWEEILIEESKKTLDKTSSIDLFCDAELQRRLRSDASDLASGKIHGWTRELMLKRDLQSEQVRNFASQSISRQPDLVRDLRAVEPAALSTFLDEQVGGPTGCHLLAKYLSQIFPMFKETLPMAADELATMLLESSSNRVARAIVRSDIYQNWRAARKDCTVVQQSVPDDSYHVVNAGYCDQFVTEDRDGQADAASHALFDITASVYRDRQVPFFHWLEEQIQLSLGLAFMEEHRETFRALASPNGHFPSDVSS